MGCWDERGCGICQTCRKVGPGHEVRRLAIDFLRVLGWHHGAGETFGGQQYEVLLCPACSKDEKRAVRAKPVIEQDVLPMDWGSCEVEPTIQGGHTR